MWKDYGPNILCVPLCIPSGLTQCCIHKANIYWALTICQALFYALNVNYCI